MVTTTGWLDGEAARPRVADSAEPAYFDQGIAAARDSSSLLFGLAALGFLLTPLLRLWLSASAGSAPTEIWLCELGLIVPAATLGLIVQRSARSAVVIESVSLAALLAIGVGLLWLAQHWPRHGIPFPPYFLSLFVFCSLVMTGIRTARLLPLALGLLVLNTALGYHRSGWTLQTHFEALADALVATIGTAACLQLRRLHRRQWQHLWLRERQAMEDPLTGIANRRAFERVAEATLAQARRERQPVALAMIDIDKFKRLNDRHGHAAGDAALMSVAETLRRFARRPLDCAVRLGGDEFAVLWFGVNAEQAAELSRSLVRELEAKRLRLDRGTAAIEHPTATLGAVGGQPGELTIADLQMLADLALYEAKRDGGNRARVHELGRGLEITAMPLRTAQDSV